MDIIKKNKIKETLFIILFVIIALHPVIELDYLATSFFDNLSIPRLTTIIDYVVLPILVILIFIFYEKDKKKVLIILGIYCVIFGIYFYFHVRNANSIQYTIHLTENFYFSLSDEIIYTVTLLLPLVYVYIFTLRDISENVFKKIVVCLSCTIAIPIFISNIFLFGKSTYVGYTQDNIFSWFSLPYERFDHHPRTYATKFFFEEGNTIGILLIMILPFLYYFMYRELKTYKKVLYGILITIQSLAMIILSTRLATYCSLIIPIAMIVIYVFLMILKYEQFKTWYLAFTVVQVILTSIIIPYSPAYQNQKIDADDYQFILKDENQREVAKGLLKDAEGLEKWSEPWRDFYVYMFEDYQFLMNVTPPIYYTEWYSYKYDPQFWVDLIFDHPLEERVNGRQIETFFTKYKWEELTTFEKLTGFGYGTFMRGGIIIERDFVQQFYSYGLIGFILIMCPWIVILLYLGIKLLTGYKKKKWNYFNIILFMSICIGFISSYISGHVFDELTTSMFISLCCGLLFNELRDKEKESIVLIK